MTLKFKRVLAACCNVDVMNVLASGSSDTIDVIQVFGDTTRVTVNSFNTNKWVPVDFAVFTGLTVEGDLGDDTLVVDNSNGLVAFSSGIIYDGGPGEDHRKPEEWTQHHGPEPLQGLPDPLPLCKIAKPLSHSAPVPSGDSPALK